MYCIFRSGVRSLRRSSVRFMSSDSLKPSRGPRSTRSVIGSSMERTLKPFVSSTRASGQPSASSTVSPYTAACTIFSISAVRSAPFGNTTFVSRSSIRSSTRSGKRYWISGRTTSSAISLLFTMPSAYTRQNANPGPEWFLRRRNCMVSSLAKIFSFR